MLLCILKCIQSISSVLYVPGLLVPAERETLKVTWAPVYPPNFDALLFFLEPRPQPRLNL